MQCHAQDADGFARYITVDLEESEVDRHYIKVYSDFAFRYSFDGIEEGKATPADIDAAFGRDAIVAAVADAIHTNTFPKAMDALDLIGLGSPIFQPQTAPLPGQAYRYTAVVECSPLLDLSSYEPVHLSLPSVDANDAQAIQGWQRLRETEAMAAIAKRLSGDLPEVLCDAEEESIVQAVYAQANAANVPFTDYLAQQGFTLDAFNQDVMRRAQDSVRSDLALDAWAAHAHMQVSDERMQEEFNRQNLTSPALEMAEWRASGRLPQLRQAIRRRMALDDIVEHAIIEVLDQGE